MPLPPGHSAFLCHQPKLNAIKSRKNVESFLTACRQLGLPEVRWGSWASALGGGRVPLLEEPRPLLHAQHSSQALSSCMPAPAAFCSPPTTRLTLACPVSWCCVFSPLPQVCLCSASDILLQGHARGLLRLLEALLQPLPAVASAGAGRSFAPTSLSEHLAGFGVFYVSVMLLLYLAYHKLCGF